MLCGGGGSAGWLSEECGFMNANPNWWSRNLDEIRNDFSELVQKRFPQNAQSIHSALKFAETAHQNQQRKGDGGPYIIHPLRVAISIIEELGYGEDSDLVKAALLHDTLEDAPSDPASLHQFGETVMGLVQTLTRAGDEKRGPEGDQVDSSYLARIRQAGEQAVALKLADKIDNMRDAVQHPQPEKRRLYVRETLQVYLPLARSLTNLDLAATLVKLLRQAVEGHLGDPVVLADSTIRGAVLQELALQPGIDSYFDSLAVQRVLFAEFTTWSHRRVGEPFLPSACLRHLQEGLAHYHLQNPELAVWLSWDGVQVVPTCPSIRQLAANVARSLLGLLQAGQAEFLLRLACLPSAFAPARGRQKQDQMQHKWTRVERQLEVFLPLVESDQMPAWLAPVVEPQAGPCIFLVLQSLAFGPLSWNSPAWQADLAVIETEQPGNRYAHTSATTTRTEQWHQVLRFLLLHRNAFWHYWRESGALRRLAEVLMAAREIAPKPRTLLSARLLCEYLDVATEDGVSENINETFGRIWEETSGKALDAATFLPAQHRQEPRTIELRGAQQVQRRFVAAGLDSEFKVLLGILEREVMQHGKVSRWIDFDTEELRKRWKQVESGIKGLNGKVALPDLEKYAVLVSREDTADSVVLRVRPSRAFALLNRLPETTPGELHAITAQGFSAISIFDTLLRTKLTEDGQGRAVWIPRVYRILDSMADLNPEHVQKIRVSFHSGQRVPQFIAWLPIPDAPEANPGAQLERKQILARYLATEIYNYALVRRVFGARYECDEAIGPTPAHAFTNEELQRLIHEAELAYGQRRAYRAYLESFNFESFTIKAGEQPDLDSIAFTPDVMKDSQCAFLGIDIGGTDVKFCLIREGRAVTDPNVFQRPLGRFSTFAGPGSVEASAFCQRIVQNIHDNLKKPAETWASLSAIGLSWPGAVRNSRIVCPSGTLVRITSQGKKFGYDSPPADIHALDLTETFLAVLRAFAKEKGFGLQDSLVCTVENDGNAEAFGNYCLRALREARELATRHEGHARGTIVIKLGTSLAGGRIDSSGAVADDVSEFGRAVLNLNVPEAGQPAGTARSLLSSLAVRNLSRSFEFVGNVLFGTRAGKNDEACIPWRIESIELGQLLPLWKAVDRDEEFLKALVGTDNQPALADVEKLQANLAQVLPSDPMRHKLVDVIRLRGKERLNKAQAAGYYLWAQGEPERNRVQWTLGLQRLHWLCNGQEVDCSSVRPDDIPSSFPFGDLARSVLGSVALFSQLGLQVAHLIALLYNVYRRGTFAHVILAGGVLAGDTGKLVRMQTDAFFGKYYDKIKAHFPEDAITLADTGEDPDAVGPIGAAMVANRQHKLNALAVMRRRIEKLVRGIQAGGVVTLAEPEQHCRDVRVAPDSIRDFLQNLAAQGALAPTPNGSYRKI